MIKPSEFAVQLQAALTENLEGDSERTLQEFLANLGFDYPARTATNLRLLAESLPIDALAPMVLAAQATAMPVGGGQLGVPQRHDDERHQAVVGARTPLLDHPVVVRPHAGQPELAIGHLGERL